MQSNKVFKPFNNVVIDLTKSPRRVELTRLSSLDRYPTFLGTNQEFGKIPETPLSPVVPKNLEDSLLRLIESPLGLQRQQSCASPLVCSPLFGDENEDDHESEGVPSDVESFCELRAGPHNSSESMNVKRWFFTDFDVSAENILKWKNWFTRSKNGKPVVQWAVIGAIEVAPSTGKHHIHGAWVSNSYTNIVRLKKMFSKAKFLHMKGTADQVLKYISKDGDLLFEFGQKPANVEEQRLAGKKQGEKNRELWLEMLELAKKGLWNELALKYPKHFVTQVKNLKQAVSALQNAVDIDDDQPPTCLWFYGESGTGKSRIARALYGGKDENNKPLIYNKAINKWWDGYIPGQSVLMEEVDPSNGVFITDKMKVWPDRYAFNAEYKGGVMNIRPNVFVVTSNYHPRQVWNDVSNYEPVLRRFKVFQCNPVGSEVCSGYLDYYGENKIIHPLKYFDECNNFDKELCLNELF